MDVQLLECTIRDGSNEVDFQFTAEDAATMAAALDSAGFAYIEAGHGWAMGANAIAKTPQMLAREGKDITGTLDDQEYFRVIKRVMRNAQLGALFAPGAMGGGVLGREWIDMAADSGLGFLRLAGFANTVDRDYPKGDLRGMKGAMRVVKDRGMTLSINLMQTYVNTPEQVGEVARGLVDAGADWIYVVDSSGCMVPDQVARYVEAICKRAKARVGFHSHNNTQTALSNCLAAIDAGATLVDGSLQGIGRATGNAPTESLLALLQYRRNIERNIDQNLVFNLGRNLVRPWIKAGFDPSHVLSGIGKLHSDRIHAIGAAAKTHGYVLDDLMVEVGQKFEEKGILQTFTNDDVATACQGVVEKRGPKKQTSQDFSDLLSVLADHDGRFQDTGAVLKQLKVQALRDRRKSLLAFVRPSLWSFAGPSVVLRDTWAVGVVPCDRVDFTTKEDISWLHGICVDDALPRPESSLPMRAFSLSRMVAEAVTMRLPTTSSLIACDDNDLARDLAGRLWRSENLVLGSGQVAPQRDFGAAFLQGKSGWQALQSDAFRSQLRSSLTVFLIGSESLEADVLSTVGKADVRLPDVWSLLAAFAASEDAVEMVDRTVVSSATAGRSVQILSGTGEVLDWRHKTVLGRWAPLASKAEGDRLSIPAIKGLYEDRIAQILSLTPPRGSKK